jgi:hypothetical protein
MRTETATAIVRPFDNRGDAGFIFSTWSKGVYFSSFVPILTLKNNWFRDHYEHVKNLLQDTDTHIRVVAMSDSPDMILGYSVREGDMLEWIYVKEAYRRQGLAKLLLKDQPIHRFNSSQMTKIGQAIFEKHPDIFKGEKHE